VHGGTGRPVGPCAFWLQDSTTNAADHPARRCPRTNPTLYSNPQHAQRAQDKTQADMRVLWILALLSFALGSYTVEAGKRKRPDTPANHSAPPSPLPGPPPPATKRQRTRRYATRRYTYLRHPAPTRARQANAPYTHEGNLRVGAWNVQRLGATNSGISEAQQLTEFTAHWHRWHWDAALLSDVKWQDTGPRQVPTPHGTWVIVSGGRVAIALSPTLAAVWDEQGSHWAACPARHGEPPRIMSVTLPRRGTQRGVFHVSVYSWIGDKKV